MNSRNLICSRIVIFYPRALIPLHFENFDWLSEVRRRENDVHFWNLVKDAQNFVFNRVCDSVHKYYKFVLNLIVT